MQNCISTQIKAVYVHKQSYLSTPQCKVVHVHNAKLSKYITMQSCLYTMPSCLSTQCKAAYVHNANLSMYTMQTCLCTQCKPVYVRHNAKLFKFTTMQSCLCNNAKLSTPQCKAVYVHNAKQFRFAMQCCLCTQCKIVYVHSGKLYMYTK